MLLNRSKRKAPTGREFVRPAQTGRSGVSNQVTRVQKDRALISTLRSAGATKAPRRHRSHVSLSEPSVESGWRMGAPGVLGCDKADDVQLMCLTDSVPRTVVAAPAGPGWAR